VENSCGSHEDALWPFVERERIPQFITAQHSLYTQLDGLYNPNFLSYLEEISADFTGSTTMTIHVIFCVKSTSSS